MKGHSLNDLSDQELERVLVKLNSLIRERKEQVVESSRNDMKSATHSLSLSTDGKMILSDKINEIDLTEMPCPIQETKQNSQSFQDIDSNDQSDESSEDIEFDSKWKLIESGKLEELRERVKAHYNITTNYGSGKKYVRLLKCKNKECLAKAMLIQYLKEVRDSQLLFSVTSHALNCPYKDLSKTSNPFNHIEMKKLIDSQKPPKMVIKEFNKKTKLNIVNNEDNRKKISNLRSYKKRKEKSEEMENFMVFNSEQMLKYINENTLNQEEILTLDGNTLFVAGAIKDEENLTVIITTKNLLLSCYKQSLTGEKFWCVDGTYRLINIEYPSLVLGTVNNNKKLSIIAFEIVRKENSQSYQCLFESILKSIRIIKPDFDLEPDFVMADFSSIINLALRNTIPDCTHLHCRFHFFQLMNGKMRSKKLFPKKVFEVKEIPARFREYFNTY